MKQGYAYEVRDNNGLTADVLRAKVPALFAQEPHESRSARYTYVPTIEIIKGMLKEGFVPVQAMQAKPKQADKLEYAKHLVKFRRAGELVVGEDIAEIVLVNSHDGSSSYQLMGGVFRVVCTNGLIRGDLQNDIRVPHKGDILDGVIDAAYTVTYMASETLEHVNEMKALPIPAAERNLFAEYALKARFELEDGEEPPFKADRLLNTRRYADDKKDLYTTLNVVQENVIKGGITSRDRNYKRHTTKEIKGIDQNVKLNKLLWSFADELRKLHGGIAV